MSHFGVSYAVLIFTTSELQFKKKKSKNDFCYFIIYIFEKHSLKFIVS